MYERASSQGLLFSEAKKPRAEAAGHGRRGWCAWSPTTPGLLRGPVRETHTKKYDNYDRTAGSGFSERASFGRVLQTMPSSRFLFKAAFYEDAGRVVGRIENPDYAEKKL